MAWPSGGETARGPGKEPARDTSARLRGGRRNPRAPRPGRCPRGSCLCKVAAAARTRGASASSSAAETRFAPAAARVPPLAPAPGRANRPRRVSPRARRTRKAARSPHAAARGRSGPAHTGARSGAGNGARPAEQRGSRKRGLTVQRAPAPGLGRGGSPESRASPAAPPPPECGPDHARAAARGPGKAARLRARGSDRTWGRATPALRTRRERAGVGPTIRVLFWPPGHPASAED